MEWLSTNKSSHIQLLARRTPLKKRPIKRWQMIYAKSSSKLSCENGRLKKHMSQGNKPGSTAKSRWPCKKESRKSSTSRRSKTPSEKSTMKTSSRRTKKKRSMRGRWSSMMRRTRWTMRRALSSRTTRVWWGVCMHSRRRSGTLRSWGSLLRRGRMRLLRASRLGRRRTTCLKWVSINRWWVFTPFQAQICILTSIWLSQTAAIPHSCLKNLNRTPARIRSFSFTVSNSERTSKTSRSKRERR